MKKEGIFDILFWVGLAISLLFLFFKSAFSIIGIIIVLVSVMLVAATCGGAPEEIIVEGVHIIADYAV